MVLINITEPDYRLSIAFHLPLPTTRHFLYVDLQKNNRSSQHTHYGCDDNSGYLVSRIRIRCSVVASITDKQAGTAAAFLQPINPVQRFIPLYLSAVYNDIFYGAYSLLIQRRTLHILY